MASISAVADGRVRGARAFSAAFAAAIAAAALGFEATPAAAKAGARSSREVKRAEVGTPERPLFAVISIADQRVSIYNHHGLVERSAISTGVSGHPTPKGVFTIIGRERFHHSNIYSGAPMPFMQRLTWSGIAMHLGVVPGHPASHGCIRLPAGFAARLWGLTRIGERVVIAPQDVAPAEFSHPLLPAPKMQVLAEVGEAAPALGSPTAPAVAAEPPLVNPRRYAEQLKAKAAAEAAAAVKAAKETSAAVGVKQQEAARAASELKAAEAAHASAQAKAAAAAKVLEAAVAAVKAGRQESVVVAELGGAEGDVSGKAEAGRLANAHDAAKAAAETARKDVDAALADAAAKLDAAKAASAAKAAELADAVRRWSEAKAASDAAVKAEKEALVRMSPLSVLVSKKDQRIYVRQGLAPLFDAPANVRDPETPVGSHLYIATAAEGDGASLKWSVVSMPTQFTEARSERRRKTALVEERTAAAPKPRGIPSSAAEALERVEIAQDVRDRIAERLWTGGSLIISDQPLSGETGAVGTDLTVKLR